MAESDAVRDERRALPDGAPDWPQRIRITCRGVAPMIQDRGAPRRAISNIVSGQALRTRVEEAAEKLFLDGGRVGIPADHLYAALRNAASAVAKEKNLFGIDRTFQLPALITFEKSFLPFPPESLCPNLLRAPSRGPDIPKGWVPDVRRVSQGTACRALFPEWGLDFEAIVEYGRLGEKTELFLRYLFNRAGKLHGLGSYRPPNGRFGCFELLEYVVLGKAQPRHFVGR